MKKELEKEKSNSSRNNSSESDDEIKKHESYCKANNIVNLFGEEETEENDTEVQASYQRPRDDNDNDTSIIDDI